MFCFGLVYPKEVQPSKFGSALHEIDKESDEMIPTYTGATHIEIY